MRTYLRIFNPLGVALILLGKILENQLGRDDR
jgi:hypothetical protein